MAERQDGKSEQAGFAADAAADSAGHDASASSPADTIESIAAVFRNITPDSIIVKRNDIPPPKTKVKAEPVKAEAGRESGSADSAESADAKDKNAGKRGNAPTAAEDKQPDVKKPAVNMSFVTETAEDAAAAFVKDLSAADKQAYEEAQKAEREKEMRAVSAAAEKSAAPSASSAVSAPRLSGGRGNKDAVRPAQNVRSAPEIIPVQAAVQAAPQPNSAGRFENFIESRLPVFSFFRRHICEFRVPNNLNYFWTFGGILTLVLIAQILTGLAVAMHYVPSVEGAFASRQTLMRDVPFGWLFLPWHAVGASFFFIAAYIHLARGLYYGSHRTPRELVWIIGAAIYCVMMAIAFFGYVLVWGMMSSSAAAVITGLFKAVPLIGSWLNETLLGGYSLGQPLLSRFYVLHFLLPFILLALVGLHIIAVHCAGQNNPSGRPCGAAETVPFVPYAAVKDILAIAVFLLFFCWFLFYMPDYMGHADNFIQADTLKTSPHIVPEWYFLPFYAMLKAMDFDIGFISSTLLGVIVLFAAIMMLFFLPWLDRSPVYSARYRPLYRIFYWLFIADVVLLGWLGACPPQAVYIHAAQAATAYYFIFFLIIMPFLPKLEMKSRAYAQAAQMQKGGGQ